MFWSGYWEVSKITVIVKRSWNFQKMEHKRSKSPPKHIFVLFLEIANWTKISLDLTDYSKPADCYCMCGRDQQRERGKNPTVALQLSSLSLLSYWVWKDAWTCPAQDIFCPRNIFCNWSIFSLWNWYCQKKRVHTCLCMCSWTPSKFKFKYGMLAGISEGAHLISKLC